MCAQSVEIYLFIMKLCHLIQGLINAKNSLPGYQEIILTVWYKIYIKVLCRYIYKPGFLFIYLFEITMQQ